MSSHPVSKSTVTSSNSVSTTNTVSNPSNSLAFIAECRSFLASADKALPQGDTFTSLDKKRGAKNKKGAERFIPQLVALAKQHGVDIPLVPLDVIEHNLSEAQALAPLEKEIGRLQKRITDRLFAAQSVSWGTSTTLYSVLRRLSKKNGELEAGLAPVTEFFAARHRSVTAEQKQARLERKATKAAKAAGRASAKLAAAVALEAAVAAVDAPPATPPAATTAP